LKATEQQQQQSAAPHAPEGPEWLEVIPVWQAAFFTDSNRTVKELQRDTFPQLVYELFDRCRNRYLAACELVGAEGDLAEHVRDVVQYDRPFLQRVYRKVAAFYRFAFVGDEQLHLPLLARSHRQEQADAWVKFFQLETKRLAADDRFCRAALRAVAYPGDPQAAAAEAYTVDLLDTRYGSFCLQRRLQLLKLSINVEALEGWRFLEDIDWGTVIADPRCRPNPPV
jgi:hypothetical protein